MKDNRRTVIYSNITSFQHYLVTEEAAKKEYGDQFKTAEYDADECKVTIYLTNEE